MSPFYCLVYLVFTILSPITFLALGLLWIYHHLVDAILSARHGKEYGGLMQGTDQFWCVEGKSRSIISTVSILDAQQFDPKVFADQLRDSLYSKNIEKLLAVRRKSMGYFYLLKNRCSWEDIVEFYTIDEERGQDGLEELISNHCNKPLPCNDTALWQILIANNPICIGGKRVCPVYFRFHHSLGDGPSLLVMTLDLLDKKVDLNIPEPVAKPSMDGWAYVTSVLWYTFLVITAFPLYITEMLLYGESTTPLHGAELTEDKWAVYHSEDKPDLVNKVKELKRQCPGALFENFLMCATSQACVQHIQKVNGQIPDCISSILPVPMPEKDFSLSNTVSMCKIRLPTKSDNPLRDICKQTQSLRKSPVVPIYYFLMTVIMQFIPYPIIACLSSLTATSMCMSSLPGPTQFSVFRDNRIEDMMFWIPNRENIGVCISIFTYAGRFQFGILVDKVLIPQREDAKKLLQRIVDNLNQMHKEMIEQQQQNS